mmetsp:Transcript_36598/g.117628  ORF Transcript_36598/g.117628 Transcript_36598/m.117628 type:complete len:305 (-) Transcript_36598:115-1029(-)
MIRDDALQRALHLLQQHLAHIRLKSAQVLLQVAAAALFVMLLELKEGHENLAVAGSAPVSVAAAVFHAIAAEAARAIATRERHATIEVEEDFAAPGAAQANHLFLDVVLGSLDLALDFAELLEALQLFVAPLAHLFVHLLLDSLFHELDAAVQIPLERRQGDEFGEVRICKLRGIASTSRIIADSCWALDEPITAPAQAHLFLGIGVDEIVQTPCTDEVIVHTLPALRAQERTQADAAILLDLAAPLEELREKNVGDGLWRRRPTRGIDVGQATQQHVAVAAHLCEIHAELAEMAEHFPHGLAH